MKQKKIFIGSSVAGLEVAYAIQEELEFDADCKIWKQGIFNLTASTLSELMIALSTFDFGIFVFTADDPVDFKDEQLLAVRDNVIFEAGLFIGRLGPEKVFFIKPRNIKRIKLPTDLLGITFGEYDETKTSLTSAVGTFCNQVRRSLKKFETGSNQTLPALNLSKIRELKAKHEVKILNDNGDALISKTLEFTVLEDSVLERTHSLFCDNNSMNWEDINFNAKDIHGHKLHVDLELDSPNRKSVKIQFRKCLYKNESIEYSYSYNWKKMFPQKNEYFTLKMASPDTTFILIYPEHWNIQYVRAVQNIDGIINQHIKVAERNTQTIDGFIYEDFIFENDTLNSEIKVSWKKS